MLYSKVGKLKVELESPEEVCAHLVMIRRTWIEFGKALAVAQQCLLLAEVRRTTRDSAIARNRLVAASAAELCVPYISDNSPLAETVQLAVPTNFK